MLVILVRVACACSHTVPDSLLLQVGYRLQQRALFTELYFAIKRRQMAQQGTRRTEQEVYTPNLVPVPTGRDSEALE